MNTNVLQQFADLALEEKDLKVQMDAIKAKKAAIAPAAQAELMLAGLKNAPLASGITVFVETKLWAKAVRIYGPDGVTPLLDDKKKEMPDWPTACAGLRDEGLGEYVGETFNVQSLSAYFRQLRKEVAEQRELPTVEAVEPDELLTPGLAQAIILSDAETLKATRN